jgi:hypothetical protein
MKRMALDAIHDSLVPTLRKDAVTYSTVTKYTRSPQFSGREEAKYPEAPDVECSPVDEAILTALAEFPLPFLVSSVRELSRRICLPRSTVHRAPAPHATMLLHGAISSMGPPRFDGGTKVDSGPNGNQTIAGPLGAKYAPVARHCHLGRVVDLFVQ